MQLSAALFSLLALTTFTPTASAAVWNDKLKVWNIGRVATTQKWDGKYRTWPVRDAGSCGGIPNFGYVCGSSKDRGVMALRAIYVCEKGRLIHRETCRELDRNDQCVKNERRKGKKFYPFVSGDRIVCVAKKDANRP